MRRVSSSFWFSYQKKTCAIPYGLAKQYNRMYCDKKETKDFWEDLVGVDGDPNIHPEAEEMRKQQEVIQERMKSLVDTYFERGGTVGDAITEDEFNNQGLKKGEKRVSLYEYAETLQGEEKSEFLEWLNRKTGEEPDTEEEEGLGESKEYVNSDHDSEVNKENSDYSSDDHNVNSTKEDGSDHDIGFKHEVNESKILEESDIEDSSNENFDDISHLVEETKNTPKKNKKKEEQEIDPIISEEQWKQQEEQRQKRKELRKNRVPFSVGTVTLPQGLRDRIDNLLKKFYKKREYNRPTLHVGKHELTEKEKQQLAESSPPTRKGGVRIPTRAENKKMIKQALHAHVFADPVDAHKVVNEGTFPQIIFGKPESLAFVENFTTGQYSIIYRILQEIEILMPNFTPRMVLDFGSGPGTTLFAADEVWGSNIMKHFLAIEPSSAMLDISQVLNKYDNRVVYRRYLSLGKESADYDLVVSSCSFTYLQTARERRDTLRSLWRSVKPGGLLVFSEVGSPVGHQMIKFVRDVLLSEDVPARIIAPCPHHNTCPMGEQNWCHFKQRTFLLQHERSESKSYRDVPFSYLVALKPGVLGENSEDLHNELLSPKQENAWSRIVRQPRKRGGHVYLDLCTPQGKYTTSIITKSKGKSLFASARKSKWGDGFIDPEANIPDVESINESGTEDEEFNENEEFSDEEMVKE